MSRDPKPSAQRIASVYGLAQRFAIEFPTEEARNKYLKDHPGADPHKHTVTEKKDTDKSPKPSFREGDKVRGTRGKWIGKHGEVTYIFDEDEDAGTVGVLWEGEKRATPAPASALRKA